MGKRPAEWILIVGSLVAIGLGIPLPAAQAAESTPDAFGYTWRDGADGPPYNYEFSYSAGIQVGFGDDDNRTITLPFGFEFYGQSYGSLRVHSNGGITFGGTEELSANHTCPVDDRPDRTVLAYWMDLDPSAASGFEGIYVDTKGSEPNRVFLIEWFQIERFVSGSNDTNHATFEIKLFEADHHIEFHYDDVDFGGSDFDDGTAAVIGLARPEGALISNDEVASMVDQHPDRLVGIACVDLRKPMDAVRELRRAVNELGFKGLRMLPWLWEAPPNDRRYYPLYAACVELGVPFCLQVGHAGPLRPSEPGRPIPYLDQVAIDFPELTIVGGHIGYPWTTEMIALATKYPNVYIDTSAYKPSRYPDELVRFMKTHGKKKVLFGSNFPMIQPAQCMAQLESLGLDEEGTALFLRDNALRVFDLA